MLIGTEKNPKGPSFKGAQWRQKELSGTLLRFKSPKPTGEFNFGREETPDKLDIFQSDAYIAPSEISESYKGDASLLSIYSASWNFRGLPIIQGFRGWVTLAANVYSLDTLPANESLFEPVVFIREIQREIRLGRLGRQHPIREADFDFTNNLWPSYLVPLNWQWVARGGADWLYFEVQPLSGTDDNFCWLTPIDTRHFLRFNFCVTRCAHNAGNPYRLAQRISLKPYTDLMHNIMDSLELQLSPEVEQQKASIVIPPQPWPIVALTPEQIQQAKYVMHRWSAKGYTGTDSNTKDHRAPPEDVAAFIDQRIKPVPLPGSYGQPQSRLTDKRARVIS